MAKRSFLKPVILMNSGWGGEGSDTGGGSGGTSDDITLVDFDEWIEMYGVDENGDGDYLDDYIAWWAANFDKDPDLWELINPTLDYPF